MAMAVSRAAFLIVAAVATLSVLPALAKDENCVYTIYVRTGSIWRGGTESTITLELYDTDYTAILIRNLTAWGGNLQGSNRVYFERGALDIFSGLGDCLEKPICGLHLSSDGLGDGHGWYVNYLETTFTGAHLKCSQHMFRVDRWLALDTYPWSLVYESDECASVKSLPTKQDCDGGQSAR